MPDRAVVDGKSLTWTPPNERRTFYLIDERETIYAQACFECFTDNGEQWSVFLPLDHPDNYNRVASEHEAKAWAEMQVRKLHGWA